ncbi:kinase-like protein [Obba rivulosa]|uniref:Kinase-like protein n=1 Tax=Obba rivulosa TaxID=1052685 RepID=A0A8E2DQR2_9APHY|nr:kinase-like protein [Obba rivulosa]
MNELEHFQELQRDQKESPKRELIVQSLSYLERTTGKIDLKKQPRWIITYYDVTIDPKAELGGGGFGVVIRGEWRGLPVAVKRIKSNDLKELTREVETWYNLRHDHIVPCYGASLTAEPPFIVLRYMEKGDLLRYLRQNPDANRVKLINEVSLGMRYLHDEKIVHGDIKVVNVLVDDSGKACLTDFGLSIKAQKNESPKRSRSAAGTLRYMAPEAIRGDLTFATDVYSFGMLIFEVFSTLIHLIRDTDILAYACRRSHCALRSLRNQTPILSQDAQS